MKFRTPVYIAATVACLSLLSACGSATAEPAENENTSKGALAMSFPTHDVTIWRETMELTKPLVEEAGYELITDNPDWDLGSQVDSWTNWIQRGDVEAIMGFPIQADSMVPVTAEASASGIPIIAYAGAWEGTSAQLVLDVEEAGKQVGSAAGQWIKDEYSDQPVKVGLLADTRADLGRLQAEGIKAGLESSGANVTIYDLDASTRDDGYNAAETHLTAHPDTKVWLGIGADMVLGARHALIDSGVKSDDPNYYVSSTDGNNEVFSLISGGEDIWRETYVWSPMDLAEASAKLLISAAEDSLEGDINVATTHVTQDNANDFLSE